MNAEKLSSLLDRIYELEGLVHLALARDDNPSGLDALIAAKASQVAAEAGQLRLLTADAEPEPEPAPEMLYATGDAERVEDEAAEAAEAEEAPDADQAEEQAPAEAEAEHRVLAEAVVTTLNDGAAPKRRLVNDSARGRLVFSLNDKFRFRRSLFGNNDNVFSSTLGEVAAMESYDEAENYFYGELQWQPENEEVAAFMQIIKGYFES